jgi:hypothetical protein
MRSNDDNLVQWISDMDQQQRLATWSGLEETELALVLKDCQDATDAERAAARDLLMRCLQAKPEARPTMEAVLEFAFISGRTADMQLILGNQGAIMSNQGKMDAKMDALAVQLRQAKVTITILTLHISLTRTFACAHFGMPAHRLDLSPGVAHARYAVGG